MSDLFEEHEALPVEFNPHWLTLDEALGLSDRLKEEVNWRQDVIGTPGGPVPLPRLTAWQGEPGAVYVYSGIRNVPEPWTPTVSALRLRLQRELGAQFNSVLLNRYRGGADSISWHSDDERELGPEPVIASVSLGVTRTFELRHRKNAMPVERYALSSGSLLVMKGRTQQDWQHRIPKEPKVQGERINLTFRLVRG